VIVGDETGEVGQGEGVCGLQRVSLTVVLDDGHPALELRHGLVKLPPFQRHVLQLDATSSQLGTGTLQTRLQLTHCTHTQQQHCPSRFAPGSGTDYQRPSDQQNCRSLHSRARSRPTCSSTRQCWLQLWVSYTGAVVTVQRVRHRLQIITRAYY